MSYIQFFQKKSAGELLVLLSDIFSSVSETPSLDAEILISHVSGLSRVELFTKRDHLLTEKELFNLGEMISKRMNKVPVAYITGIKNFYKNDFYVSSEVLIPRPDTEILVEEAVNFIKKQKSKKAFKPDVLDICTGTGCIGISVHNEVGGTLILSDISEETLEITKENVANLIGDPENIQIIQSDRFNSIKGTFDLITANPPYLSFEDMGRIKETPVIHEPERALYGGENGFELSEIIIKEAAKFLKKGGALFMELGYEGFKYADKVKCELKFLRYIKDYAGIERVAVWIKE